MASLSLSTKNVSATVSTITATLVGLDSNYWTNWGTSKTPRYTSATISVAGAGSANVGRGGSNATDSATFSVTPGVTYTASATIHYLTTSGSSDQRTFTGSITAAAYVPPRPSNWSWPYTMYSGGSVRALTAQTWQSFTDRINAFRVYKGMSEVYFARPSSGSTLLAGYIASAIDNMAGIPTINKNYLPSKPASGTPVNMSIFTALASALNSIT